ncbi:hypothetical protein [Streptomyces sp900116325]|uniref:hypothetical protein n=1 Tax=Streptomyces sp. 900116325 TaxID=3154295 RepID=UPI0033210F09
MPDEEVPGASAIHCGHPQDSVEQVRRCGHRVGLPRGRECGAHEIPWHLDHPRAELRSKSVGVDHGLRGGIERTAYRRKVCLRGVPALVYASSVGACSQGLRFKVLHTDDAAKTRIDLATLLCRFTTGSCIG